MIVVSLAATLALFQHAQQEPRTRQMAQLVVSVVNLTRAAVLSAAPEWRSALLAELAASESIRVQLAEREDVIKPLPDHPPELRLMMARVRTNLGIDTRFAAEVNGVDALWVSFFIGRDEFWIGLPKERIEHPVSQVLLMWGSIVLLLALLGSYFIARQVARPLMRLSQAAQQLGQGVTPLPLTEQGAREVMAVSAAFNQMSADLLANERERALVLAGISHDLRTPLARIRIAAELSANESLREGLVADVEQMDAVIQQFLDYARLDEHEVASVVDLQALLTEVTERFSGDIRLELQPMPPIRVRPLLLKRAIANLIDNAMKYGGGHITVQLTSLADKVILAIMDRGVGIPESQRSTVKRPFIRLETARSNVTGSGLGLAIVERAAQLHAGEFILETREGGGLVAKIVLPNI